MKLIYSWINLPMMYKPGEIREHYNAYGLREWDRLEKTVHGRVEYEVTMHILDRHLTPDSIILDAGGGPGRYTIELARRGYKVYLLDISDEQLKIANAKIEESGVRNNILDIRRMDICNMVDIPDHSFDAVICLGGALSYVRDQHKIALKELVRVCKPASLLVLSVMSLYGTFHLIGALDADTFLENIKEHVEWDPYSPFPDVMNSKEGSDEWHAPMTLYTSSYMRKILEMENCKIVEIASTNTITSSYVKGMEKIGSNKQAYEMLLRLEKQFCLKPGLVDMGEHIISVARTPE